MKLEVKVSWTRPARPEGSFLIIQSSPTMMNYQECHFARRKTCLGVPKKIFRQGGTYPGGGSRRRFSLSKMGRVQGRAVYNNKLKNHSSWTMQNSKKIIRYTFKELIEIYKIMSYHVDDWSWSSSSKLKLKSAGPAPGPGAGPGIFKNSYLLNDAEFKENSPTHFCRAYWVL